MDFREKASKILLQQVREAGELKVEIHRDSLRALGYLERMVDEGKIEECARDVGSVTFRIKR